MMNRPALPVGPPMLFVDLDDTVRHGPKHLPRTLDGDPSFVNEPDDVVIFPEAIDRMRAWCQDGGLVVGVTNQGGVALGYMTEATHREINYRTIDAAEGLIDEIVACLHRPDAGCWCRKPLPALIYGAIESVTEKRWVAAPDRAACLMVGDLDSDRQCAEAAGIPFLDAVEWRAGATS